MNTTFTLAERSVPRYTSYPTAPHFSAAVGPPQYAEWLGELSPAATLSLICMCRSARSSVSIAAATPRRCATRAHRCLCGETQAGDRSAGERDPQPAGRSSALGRRHAVDPRSRRLGCDSDRAAANFDLGALVEHAIELDPRAVTPELAAALKRIGIARVSFGAQDFSPHVQQAIGRVQPFEQVEAAADMVRAAGVTNINIDLMYGLPRQTIGDVIRSAELAASLEPSRLALFGYAHVPWFKSHQRLIRRGQSPGAGERMAQMHAASETLEECGYVQIGLDTFFARLQDDMQRASRTGRLHRNFQGYTTDAADALIGLGVSAIGQLPQGYVQNAPDIGSYTRAIGSGQFATVKGLALSDDDRRRADIIERLMCDLTVDLDATAADASFSAELEAIDALSQSGIVRRAGRHVEVTDEGRPFVRLVAAAFDAYLPGTQKRHSVAV